MNKQPDINATQDAESLKENNNMSEPTENFPESGASSSVACS